MPVQQGLRTADGGRDVRQYPQAVEKLSENHVFDFMAFRNKESKRSERHSYTTDIAKYPA